MRNLLAIVVLIAIVAMGAQPRVNTVTVVQADGGTATNLTVAGLTNKATGGTVFRGIDDRFAEVKNVLDYGAIGNGTTDDTLAIRAAITAAGANGRVIFPAGKTFLIGGTLTPLAGQHWSGHGATLKRCDEATEATATAITTGGSPRTVTVVSTNGFFVGMDVSVFNGSSFDANTHRITAMTATTITMGTAFSTAFPSGGTIVSAFQQVVSAAEGVIIEGLEFDGNKSNNTSLNKWQLHAEIYLAGAGSAVRDCYIHDCPAEGIILGGENSTVDHNRIIDCNGNGVHFSAATNPTVTGNYIKNCNLTGTDTGHSEGCITWSSLNRDVKVIGNHLENGISGLGNFRSEDASHVIISGNTVTNCTYVLEANIPSLSVGSVTITGNQFYNAGQLVLNNNNVDPTHTAGPYNFTVGNNLFENSRFTAIKTKGVTFTANTLTNSTTTDVLVQLVDVKDFNGNGNNLIGGGYGFYVTSGVVGNGTNNVNVSISANTLRNQYSYGVAMFRPGIVNGSVIGNTIIGQTNVVSTSYVPIYVNDGSLAQANQIYAEDGLYGIQLGNGALGGSFVLDNRVITRAGMSSIQMLSGSSNGYVRGNFVSSAVGDAGSGNFVGFNPIIGAPLATGTGLIVGSVSPSITNLQTWTRLSLVDAADTGATNHMLFAASGNSFLNTKGIFKIQSAVGAAQIDSVPGTGAAYLNFYDSLNNRTMQIRANSGSLSMAPTDGGTFQVVSYGGSVWTRVNGTAGETYFFGSGLNATTVPYLDANRQFKSSAVTPTELGYVSGVTSAIQTQIDGKAATSHTHAAADITSGTIATARLGTGTADNTTYLRGDNTWQTISAGGAPTDATYITKTANGTLSAEFAMSALATGIVKNTTTTGEPSIAVPGTDYVAPTTTGVGATAYTIPLVGMGSGSPADATIYYIGWENTSTWSSASGAGSFTNSVVIPRAGTIKSVSFNVKMTAGSNENVSIELEYGTPGGATSTAALSVTTMTWDATTKKYFGTCSVAVAAGDYAAIKITTPTWGTNPTNTRIPGGMIYIE